MRFATLVLATTVSVLSLPAVSPPHAIAQGSGASSQKSSPPKLQGATNGTIGAKGGSDAMALNGIVAAPSLFGRTAEQEKTIAERLSELVSGLTAKVASSLPQTKAPSREDFHQLLTGKTTAKSKQAVVAVPSAPPPRRAVERAWDETPAGCGLVTWHSSVQEASSRSRVTGKPVFIFEMMGRLDREFC